MTTRTLNITLASMPERIFAYLIDGALFGLITGALYPLIRNASIEGLIGFALGLTLQWYFLTTYNGQTPGKMLMGIRVVKTDGSSLTGNDALLRYLGYYLNTVLLFIGWFMAFWDKDHQGLHDRLANTYVVKVSK
jgi:uncharacterized RDD family membrane protein YckC